MCFALKHFTISEVIYVGSFADLSLQRKIIYFWAKVLPLGAGIFLRSKEKKSNMHIPLNRFVTVIFSKRFPVRAFIILFFWYNLHVFVQLSFRFKLKYSCNEYVEEKISSVFYYVLFFKQKGERYKKII